MKAAGNGKVSLNIIALQNAKRSTNLHRCLKSIFKDVQAGKITPVLIKEEEDKWTRITDVDMVQDLLVTCNVEHFNQAAETSLGDPQVMAELGWTTESNWYRRSLQGQEVLLDNARLCLEVASEFFCQFQKLEMIETDEEISYDEIKVGFKSWNENTSTSTLEWHLKHYKALFVPDSWDSKKDGPDPGEQIFRIHHRMIQIAL